MSGGVHRRKPIPTTTLQGRFVVAADVISATAHALRTFRTASEQHEGIVFWGGIQTPRKTILVTALVPTALHGPGFVKVDDLGVARAVEALHDLGLGLLAQVHSHPGDDARHSDGDDVLVLMPYEGMLSIVVPRYGDLGIWPISMCGVHQFQQRVWRLCTGGLENILLAPGVVDQR